MQQLDLDIIGTHLQIQIDTSSSCDEDFSHICSYLTDFELRYSRFIEGNWLYGVNMSRRGVLDKAGKQIIEFMLDLSEKSDGYFDPTVGKRLTELGYGNQKIKSEPIIEKKGYGDYRDIEISGDSIILHGDIFLEFGGVGKGYLIDQIQHILSKYPRFLINFGGDIYGRGGWTIGLESPFSADEIIGTIILDDHYLASSAGTRRKWGIYHHLIDPHTGESANNVISSYIEGQSGMMTDAYAMILCVMPWELACITLEKNPEISGVIVSKDGYIYQKHGSQADIFV
ncbi:FAD:protein FMN transferase [Candidatus Gracilibacteria bacterium]|nr:FAD:protein FMN transferase [Candidatus Gracilibacteria bacterium]